MNNNIIFSTSDLETLEMFPVLPASKLIPDWYKNTPVEVGEYMEVTLPHTPTIKRCVPVLDYMTTGYIIRASYEIQVKKEVDEHFFNSFEARCRHADKVIGKHPWQQAQVAVDGQKSHYMKIYQPWHIKTPPGYSCMIFDPYYHFRKTFSIFPGVVDTDKHDEPIGLVALVQQKEFTILPGDPLVVVFPFRRDDWTMSSEVRTDEYNKSSFKYRMSTYWSGIYAKLLHSKKTYR
jgi:hypothetical protein